MHSYAISKNKSWNSATRYQRRCCTSNIRNTSWTSTTESRQTTPEIGTTLTTARRGGMLVGTHHNVAGSQLLHNLIRTSGSTPTCKPTTLPDIIQLSDQEYAARTKRATLDIETWWRKHLRLPIGDQERGQINYFSIDSKPNLDSLFSFCT
jgi:hypothetical protein